MRGLIGTPLHVDLNSNTFTHIRTQFRPINAFLKKILLCQIAIYIYEFFMVKSGSIILGISQFYSGVFFPQFSINCVALQKLDHFANFWSKENKKRTNSGSVRCMFSDMSSVFYNKLWERAVTQLEEINLQYEPAHDAKPQTDSKEVMRKLVSLFVRYSQVSISLKLGKL